MKVQSKTGRQYENVNDPCQKIVLSTTCTLSHLVFELTVLLGTIQGSCLWGEYNILSHCMWRMIKLRMEMELKITN